MTTIGVKIVDSVILTITQNSRYQQPHCNVSGTNGFAKKNGESCRVTGNLHTTLVSPRNQIQTSFKLDVFTRKTNHSILRRSFYHCLSQFPRPRPRRCPTIHDGYKHNCYSNLYSLKNRPRNARLIYIFIALRSYLIILFYKCKKGMLSLVQYSYLTRIITSKAKYIIQSMLNQVQYTCGGDIRYVQQQTSLG